MVCEFGVFAVSVALPFRCQDYPHVRAADILFDAPFIEYVLELFLSDHIVSIDVSSAGLQSPGKQRQYIEGQRKAYLRDWEAILCQLLNHNVPRPALLSIEFLNFWAMGFPFFVSDPACSGGGLPSGLLLLRHIGHCVRYGYAIRSKK